MGAIALRLAALLFIALTGVVALLYVYGRDLPPIDNLADARRQPRVIVLDRYGDIIGIHGQDHGEPIDVYALPPHIIHAFIATEDRNFFHHVGVNPVAILRAFTVNMQKGGVAQGGSTITQQLVKNVLLSPERTMKRKIQEMLLALRIEARYGKDEILGFYLNAVYFGNGAYGLEAAARRYFSKDPQDLTVGEAAMLAGLLKAPSRFSPTNSENAAKGRAQVVLNAMVDAGFLNHAMATNVIEGGIAETTPEDMRTGYAVDFAVTEARQILGAVSDDLIIHTTIDAPALRATADAITSLQKESDLYTPNVQTAAIAVEHYGAIRVLIGGNDYGESVFNRVTQARRQPGSVFKPFVYLAALEQGWAPEDLIDDSPITIGDYTPKNYKDRYFGEVPLTEAMSRSLNAAVIRLQEEVGRGAVVSAARRAGLRHVADVGPALALGVSESTPLELATGFLTFANDGIRSKPFSVRMIESAAGEVMYEHVLPPLGPRWFDDDVLAPFDHMMRHVVESGSGVRARVPGHLAAGKTGTTQDSRDAWFAGYVSGMAGVVWLGKDDDTPMEIGQRYISGSGEPAVLWSAMMTAALGDRPATPPRPYTPQVDPAEADRPSIIDQLVMLFGRGDRRDAIPSDRPSAEPSTAIEAETIDPKASISPRIPAAPIDRQLPTRPNTASRADAVSGDETALMNGGQ